MSGLHGELPDAQDAVVAQEPRLHANGQRLQRVWAGQLRRAALRRHLLWNTGRRRISGAGHPGLPVDLYQQLLLPRRLHASHELRYGLRPVRPGRRRARLHDWCAPRQWLQEPAVHHDIPRAGVLPELTLLERRQR